MKLNWTCRQVGRQTGRQDHVSSQADALTKKFQEQMQEGSAEVSSGFQWSFKGVSRKFQRYFKEIQRCFKEVARLFHRIFRGISRLLGDSRKFIMSFKQVSMVVSKEFQVSWIFQVFKRVQQGCTFFLKVHLCMSLIAASRAKGRFVLFQKTCLFLRVIIVKPSLVCLIFQNICRFYKRRACYNFLFLCTSLKSAMLSVACGAQHFV